MAAYYGGMGGYNYTFIDENLDKFTCNVCVSVLKDPHLTGCCGQVFCESCLDNWFAERYGDESCPHCRAEGKDFQHFLDKRLKREIDSLRIHCANSGEGCQWIGELGSLETHLESVSNGCDYVEVECPNGCEVVILDIPVIIELVAVKMKRKDLENHLRNECYLRPYNCEHCGHSDTYKKITGENIGIFDDFFPHYHTCTEFPLECPNMCGVRNIKRKDMKDHRSQCPEEPVQCPFEEVGCKKKIARRELEQHMLATQQRHQVLVMGAYKEMKRENKELKQTNKKMEKDFEELKKVQKELVKANEDVKERLRKVEYSIYY